jgi:RNA processing factor Prp31
MRDIEKLIIQYSDEYYQELQEQFYQSEMNSFEYLDPESFKETIQAAFVNILLAEYYLEYTYKFLKEYLYANNEMVIFGTTKDDPLIVTCINISMDLCQRIKSIKKDFADVLESVFTNKQDSIRPSTITMLHTINFGSTHKQTKNSLESLQFSIKSLVRAEIAISTLDHIFTYMLVKHIKSMENYNITQERINQFTEESESIFNAFIDFKFNHLIDIKINLF